MKVSPHPPQSAVARDAFLPQANHWVQLRNRLNDYSHDQALLLCEESEGRWIAWVPDFGEAILTRDQILKPSAA